MHATSSLVARGPHRRPRQRPRPRWTSSHRRHDDVDGLDNEDFWRDYLDNGLLGTAVYYLPHLAAMPERSVAALSAVVNAPAGGVLFHCMGGRDRTGMIALLLLAAIGTTAEDIVDDYLETVRLADIRAARAERDNDEVERDALCRRHGTTTEDAFRAALTQLDLVRVLDLGGMTASDRAALRTWRGALTSGQLG